MHYKELIHYYCYSIFALLLLVSIPSYADSEPSIFDLSLRDLLKIKVTTASKDEETLDETPAYVELITQDDIQRRDYKDLSYIFEDIAGVQMTRGFGDNYFSTVWRGQRFTIGSSFLILVDGVKFNHLYNNETEILATFPLSNIKYIEVVHGAASVAYGNDAVVGIINIITTTNSEGLSSLLQVGENNKQVVDFSYAKNIAQYQLNIAGRYDHGDVDFSNAARYRWTDPNLLTNKDIWGGFTQNYADLESPHYNRAFSAKLSKNKSELSVQYYQLVTGYGLIYTFDHALPNSGLWSESEYSIHYKQQFTLTDNLSLNTMLRYRSSNIDNDSLFIESYLTQDNNNQIQRLDDASYWQSKNDSRFASADLNWNINNKWSLLAGSELEFKHLQKAYNINFGASLPPQLIDENYQLPSPPTQDTVDNNHKNTTQKNFYLLSRYSLPSIGKLLHHKLHFGVRSDHHSVFGTETTIRAGWVGQFNHATIKFFYGEAYQEPSARLLYGGWKGSGSDPRLKPRNANTWELNANYKWQQILLSANIYRLNSANLFNTTDKGAVNIGKGITNGGAIRIKYQPKTTQFERISLWSAYTWLNSKEQTSNGLAQLSWQKNIDSAKHTLHFGGYFDFNNAWQFNLRGRYYGNRSTVKTNEFKSIKAYLTIDTNISYRLSNDSQNKISLAITNLFNKKYFHPGLRSASANNSTIGRVNENGVWIGSQSFYNSKIPQPGREISLSWYYQW